MTTVAELPAGFADKVLSAQSTFRSVMDAMARPGSVQRIEAAAGTPAAMMRGTAAIALTLFDHDTPLWLDASMSQTPDVAKWLKFHTGAPVIADSSICSFALIGDAGALPDLDRFSFGSNEYPDRSTTLILQVQEPRRRVRPLSCAAPASTARRCCRPRSSRRICSRGSPSTPPCFHAASMSCWWPTTRLSRSLAPRVLSPKESRPCTSPSREASAPSRTPTVCWRMSAAATATIPEVSPDADIRTAQPRRRSRHDRGLAV